MSSSAKLFIFSASIALALAVGISTTTVQAASVLTNGTATFSQTFDGFNHLPGAWVDSVTTDPHGLATGGDVTANWTVLTGGTVAGPADMTFSTLGDNSILAGGTIPFTATYNLSFSGSFFGLTGIRLEVLENSILSGMTNGSGLQANGNFVLTEISLDASGVPLNPVLVPAALSLFFSGLLGLGVMARRRNRKAAAA